MDSLSNTLGVCCMPVSSLQTGGQPIRQEDVFRVTPVQQPPLVIINIQADTADVEGGDNPWVQTNTPAPAPLPVPERGTLQLR